MSQPPSQPGSQQAIQALLLEAEEAWGRQDYHKSIALIEQASGRDPSNPSLLLQVARAHGLRYDFAAAQRWIDRAIQDSPRRAHTLSEAGRICLEFDHMDMAIAHLERA